MAVSLLDRLPPDGPVGRMVQHPEGLTEANDFSHIDYNNLIARLTAEFPEGSMEKGWILFNLGDSVIFEIDPISGYYIVRGSANQLEEYPHGKCDEFNRIITGLKKLVRLRNGLMKLDFYPVASGADDENRYRMKMVRPILSSNAEEIVEEIKQFRTTIEKII